VDFIQWNPDIRKNVVSALVPLQQDDVVGVWISPDSLAVKVIVRSTESAHQAVGTDGVNLVVSQRLLNMHIELETKEAPLSPEEELIQELSQRIPEIFQGRIEIVKVARRVGKAAKIAIRSREIKDPKKVCIGSGGNISHLISNDLGGEQLTFVIWDPLNLEGMLRQALFPLRENEIVSISIDQNQRTAVVIVKKGGPIAIAIGKQGDNVKLAERICDLRRIEINEVQ
jgi:transcription antitermination factor NusA-like protein